MALFFKNLLWICMEIQTSEISNSSITNTLAYFMMGIHRNINEFRRKMTLRKNSFESS